MRMQYIILILCAFICAVSASGNRHELDVRQTFPCTDNSQCLAPDVNVTGPIPSRFVDCDQVCICSECFERNDEGRCFIEYPDCYYFENAECVDDRRSQLVAFLLSLFLGEVGAANFYIGQNGLGAGQLVLFLSTFLIICCGACLPLCCVCCIAGGDGEGAAKGGVFFFCVMVCVFLLVFAVSFGILGWWIAEAVIFGTNQRNDGDGCPLNPNL